MLLLFFFSVKIYLNRSTRKLNLPDVFTSLGSEKEFKLSCSSDTSRRSSFRFVFAYCYSYATGYLLYSMLHNHVFFLYIVAVVVFFFWVFSMPYQDIFHTQDKCSFRLLLRGATIFPPFQRVNTLKNYRRKTRLFFTLRREESINNFF